MVARTLSSTHQGPDGSVVEIQASLQKALPTIVITGLPGDIVRESRERIRACLGSLGFEVPSERLVVHLSPATEKKQGSQLDLGIAVAMLVCENKVQGSVDGVGFLGELSLDGRVRAVRGALALAEALLNVRGVERVFLPRENLLEASLLGSSKFVPVESLSQVLEVLSGRAPAPSYPLEPPPQQSVCLSEPLDRIQGQRLAKRALQIALAGRHHLLLVGPPGVGKSLLAQSAPFLMPALSRPELIELVKNQGFYKPGPLTRPFRSPHHSVSAAGLLGGGTGLVQSGEVTLAHTGVLFLDELPEFRKDVLEGLREPLQAGEISLIRVGSRVTLPSRFLLIGAMNPCPCGYDCDPHRRCLCPPGKAAAYRRRLSGPLYDRIDLCVFLTTPTRPLENVESDHARIRDSIARVHDLQAERYGKPGTLNGDCEVDILEGPFHLDTESREWIEALCVREYLSFRSLHKTIRVARTIADLERLDSIGVDQLREAWEFRCRDLSSWR